MRRTEQAVDQSEGIRQGESAGGPASGVPAPLVVPMPVVGAGSGDGSGGKPGRRWVRGLLLTVFTLALLAGVVLIAAGIVPSLFAGILQRVDQPAVATGPAPVGARPVPTPVVATATLAATASAEDTPKPPPRIDPLIAAQVNAAARHFEALDDARFAGQGIVRGGDRSTGMVAVTFDDGPSPNTTALINALKKAGVHGTFFFVGGRTVGHAGLVREVMALGNEIGDHTWTHTTLRGISPAIFEYQVEQAQRMLTYELLGYRPKVLRGRAGAADESLVRMAKSLGDDLLVVNWSADGDDTDFAKTPLDIANHVLKSARAGDIILLHETNPRTADALPLILSGLRDRGLKAVTVSELLAASRMVRYIPYSAASLRAGGSTDPKH